MKISILSVRGLETEDFENFICNGNSKEIIANGFGLELSRENLQTLKPTGWIDDEILNFYVMMLKDRG